LGSSVPSSVMECVTYVEIDNLDQQCDDYKHQQQVKKPLVKLRRSTNLCNDGSAESLSSHDTTSYISTRLSHEKNDTHLRPPIKLHTVRYTIILFFP